MQKDKSFMGFLYEQRIFDRLKTVENAKIVHTLKLYSPKLKRDTDIDNVDLIYFPTGGGKTETFLGCVIFSAFFDRIRGKENGATAIIKYPLRLLAAQQLDRVLVLTINANKIKMNNTIYIFC